MRASKIIMPSLVIFLSLGFFSQSPFNQVSFRRVSSVDCVNCAKDPVTPVQVPSFIPFFVDSSKRQSDDSFAFFNRQIELQTRLYNFNFNLNRGNSGMFAFLPIYPNYMLPRVENYQVSFTKPPASNQIFGGLAADPALRYLTQPGIDARNNPSVATGIAPSTLDVAAVIDANSGLAPNPNGIVSSNAVIVAAGRTNETEVAKTQDRHTANAPTSSLLGSKIVKEPVAPQVNFTRSK